MQVTELELSQNYTCTVDTDDLQRISKYKWFVIKSGNSVYASTNIWIAGKRRTVKLHRFIMNCLPGTPEIIDHINGVTLDNRKSNLRVTDRAGNSRNANRRRDNTTEYKGVVFRQRRNRYEARIRYGGKQVYLGTFKCPKEAAMYYDTQAELLWGEYAKTNKMLGLL